MANLFPEGYSNIDSDINFLDKSSVGYKRGIKFVNGDFARTGTNKLTYNTGIESWERWCQNCLATKRYSSPYYSSDFGINTLELLNSDREKTESILRREITEALEADPYGRTKRVDSFNFSFGVDNVKVGIKVTGINETTIDLLATIQI